MPLYKVWAQLEEVHRKGLAADIGVSNWTGALLIDMFSFAEILPAVNQIELHPYLQQPDLVRYCQDNEVAVVAFSPLCSPGRPFPGGRRDLLENEMLQEIAKKHSRSPAQVALRWNLQRHVAVIPKTLSLERAKENLAVFDFTLDENDMKQMEELECDARCFDPKNFGANFPVFK